jgi:hypothetical protein
VRAIHISIDPATQCKIEVSLEMKKGSAKPRQKIGMAPAKSGARCFVLGDKSYCE